MKENKKISRLKVILTIALPIIIQNIVMHFQIMIDRAFLGNLESRYLAAIGNVLIPYNALNFFFFSAATGLTVLVAQNYGRRDYNKVQRLGESSFFYSTLFSIGLFLVWILGGRWIFSLFGAEGQILQDSVTYVKILAVSLIFLGIEISAGSIFQGVGVTRPIMIFGITKSLSNIFLDWVMIYGKFGLPALGLEGAALATMISNIIAAIGIFIAVILYRDLPFKFSKRALLKPNWKLYKETLNIGIPSGIESLLWNLGQLVIVRLLNQIDGMTIGIYSLVAGIQSLALYIYLGFAKAAMTKVGQYWGNEDFEQARDIGFYCQRLSVVVTLVFGLVFLVFPKFLAGIFTSDPSVMARAVPLLRLSGLHINLQVFNVVMGHAIRGTGDTKWMLYSQIFGTIFVVSLSPVMIFSFSLGLMGMYLTLILDEGIRGGINLMRFYYEENPFKVWTARFRNNKELAG